MAVEPLVVSDNPLKEGLTLRERPDPCAMVIFGATGDLTHRKLIPALYNLTYDGYLPSRFAVVGYARRDKQHETFRQEMGETVQKFSRRLPIDSTVWNQFSKSLYFHTADFENISGFKRLKTLLEEIDKTHGTVGNRLFYLATPPAYFAKIVENLGAVGLINRDSKGTGSRIIIEKPFGRDLSSARELNAEITKVIDEKQIYRIDHYLGKETVQNILVFRFSNGIFEPIWNQKYIDHVQITMCESYGTEGRGSYLDEAGIFRDIVENHVMQLASLVAMEPPVTFDADSLRDEKVKVLKALKIYTKEEVAKYTIRGQYSEGFINGQKVPPYRQEKGVAPNSNTEMYVAMKLFIDNWRWAGVPFYLRCGKRLPKRSTEIAIQFKNVPHLFFNTQNGHSIEPNLLVLRIQPDEGISMRIGSKIPGQSMRIQPVKMDFRYGASFGIDPPEAYETLLLDAMLGDSTLFTRFDEVETAWKFGTALLEGWASSSPPPFPNYEAGTWGPKESDAFIEQDGREWRRL